MSITFVPRATSCDCPLSYEIPRIVKPDLMAFLGGFSQESEFENRSAVTRRTGQPEKFRFSLSALLLAVTLVAVYVAILRLPRQEHSGWGYAFQSDVPMSDDEIDTARRLLGEWIESRGYVLDERPSSDDSNAFWVWRRNVGGRNSLQLHVAIRNDEGQLDVRSGYSAMINLFEDGRTEKNEFNRLNEELRTWWETYRAENFDAVTAQ